MIYMATIKVDGREVKVSLPSAGIHYGVDAAAALGAARTILGSDFDLALAVRVISALDPVFGRGETITVRGQEIDFVLIQNPTSYRLNLSSLASDAECVMIAVGSVLWLGERFSKRQMLGVVLAMLGVVHVVVRGEWTHLTQVQLVPGDLWVVAAAIAWAAYALLQKKWHSPLGSTARLASICMGGIVVLLPFAVWELMSDHTPVLGLQAAQLVLVTALVPGLAAYWIYGWTQKILGASRAAVTLYLGPLYSGIAAWLVLNESLGWHHVWGGAMILSGVALVMAVKATPANP